MWFVVQLKEHWPANTCKGGKIYNHSRVLLLSRERDWQYKSNPQKDQDLKLLLFCYFIMGMILRILFAESLNLATE